MPAAGKSELYRLLPAVDEVLRLLDVAKLVEREGHVAVTEAARAVLARVRQEIAAGSLNPAALELAISGLPQAIERQLRQALQLSLRPLINATGVILHTNLGRAPLASAALDHLREVASAYSNLEFDIPNGERGKRDVHVERLFARMFAEAGDQGAVASVVVNNNAAAVLLALNTLAIMDENPDLQTEEFANEIRELILEAVELEKAYNEDMLPKGILGLNADYVNQYVMFMTDRRLEELGFEPEYHVSNPAKWMAVANDTLELVNFFESTNTSYEVNGAAK